MRVAASLSILAAMMIVAASEPAVAGDYQQVYSFQGADGADPFAGLIEVGQTLYGTTGTGGISDCTIGGCGIVFAVSPKTGAEMVLHQFKNKRGDYPISNLLDVKGRLYGTTSFGGTAGDGIVFSVNRTTGAETVLYSFLGGKDGAGPEGALINVGGTLFGTTLDGGVANEGTVFALNPTTGVERVVYSFHGGTDGAFPAASLINVHGRLYGTTANGGSASLCDNNGCGTVFSVTPTTGAEAVVYAFQGGNDGAYPEAGLLNVAGILYGTTEEGGPGQCAQRNGTGCGTVFSLNPTKSTEATVYSFRGGTDGIAPEAGVINVGGTLYGTTSGGGAKLGTVFSVDPTTGVETVLHAFGKGTDGADPTASLTNVSGTLYGTTSGGGNTSCTNGCGTVFSYTP